MRSAGSHQTGKKSTCKGEFTYLPDKFICNCTHRHNGILLRLFFMIFPKEFFTLFNFKDFIDYKKKLLNK